MNIVALLYIFIPLMIWSKITAQNGHQNYHTDTSRSVLFGPEGKFSRCCPEDALKRLHSLKTMYRSIFFSPEDPDCSRCRLYEAISRHIEGAVSEEVREASKMIVDEEFGKYFSEKLHEKRENFYRGEEELPNILEMEGILQRIQENLGVSEDAWKIKNIKRSPALPLTKKELGGFNGQFCEENGRIPMMRSQENSLEMVYPNGRTINVASPESLNSLVQFYAKAHKCLKSKDDLKDFNEKLLKWISFRILPLLHQSQRVLPAFGAIHRINATIQKETTSSSLVNFYSRFSEGSEIPRKTIQIVGVITAVAITMIVFLLAIYFCIWRARKSKQFQGRYKKLRNPENPGNTRKRIRKSSKNASGNSSKSSGEEIELFSRSGIESDSEESIHLENATIIHTSPRRKIFREFSTPAFKLLQEKSNPPKESIQSREVSIPKDSPENKSS